LPEQAVQQGDRRAGAGFHGMEDHRRHSGQAAQATPPRIRTEPASGSGPNGSPSHQVDTTSPVAGVARNLTEATMAGSFTDACMTH
jgi:hypothetical protein